MIERLGGHLAASRGQLTTLSFLQGLLLASGIYKGGAVLEAKGLFVHHSSCFWGRKCVKKEKKQQEEAALPHILAGKEEQERESKGTED